MSVGVAPQYCGALGERANCQVAVSVHAVTATASCPLQRRLLLPKEWAVDAERRTACKVPADIGHREKWRLALDILGDLSTRGLAPRVVLADAAYGTNAAFRSELTKHAAWATWCPSVPTSPPTPSTRCPRHPPAKAPTAAGPSPATASHP